MIPTNTFDFEASNVQVKDKHVVTYGGNLRFNAFDLSLAPLAENRTEGGGYLQDEIFLSPMFRLVAGARVDRFDYLDDFVFSPRLTFMVKPEENHTIRVSYNRAYRSPSVINNFLDVTIAEPLNLGAFSPQLAGRIYPIPIRSVGNQDLNETSVDAHEIGYSGVVAGAARRLGRLLRQRSRTTSSSPKCRTAAGPGRTCRRAGRCRRAHQPVPARAPANSRT